MIRQSIKKILYKFQQRSLVLMYHNIAVTETDPWELAVSPENFRQQLEVLRKHRVISVPEFSQSLLKGSLPGGSVALTFDDGYEDNYTAAKPLLERFETPAMFFIATGFAGGEKMFWWDELEQLLLSGNALPEKLYIKIGGTDFHFNLGDDATPDKNKLALQQGWKWHEPAPTSRCHLYLELWKRLRPLPLVEIHRCIEWLHDWSAIPAHPSSKHAMSREQLLSLRNNRWIQTGIHTVSHPALSDHSPAVQRRELLECRESLQSDGLLAAQVAFPYGDHNQDTLNICRELGIDAAFTTRESMVTQKTNPLGIGRFQVRNLDGEAFEKQLKVWMTEFPS